MRIFGWFALAWQDVQFYFTVCLADLDLRSVRSRLAVKITIPDWHRIADDGRLAERSAGGR